jgi:glycosyltransferase involved in cell wall biosynthesis
MHVSRVYSRLGGERRFDLAHWLFPQGLHDVLSASRRIPFIVGPHFLNWSEPGRDRRLGDLIRQTAAPLFWALHARALSRASVLLVATPDAASVFPDAYRSKVRVLPFGIDESDPVSTGDPPPEPAIAFVGRLEAVKGALKLIEAFARVKQEIPEATLVVAGDGPDRSAIEQRSRQLGLNGSVRFLGRLPHAEIPAVLRSSSVVCLPSEGEPYGMAVLEAMAAGRAVVTPDKGGPRFLLAHDRGDQLVARNEPECLARALTRLLADRQRLTRIGRENRDRVEASFTLDRVVAELESIYETARGLAR